MSGNLAELIGIDVPTGLLIGGEWTGGRGGGTLPVSTATAWRLSGPERRRTAMAARPAAVAGAKIVSEASGSDISGCVPALSVILLRKSGLPLYGECLYINCGIGLI